MIFILCISVYDFLCLVKSSLHNMLLVVYISWLNNAGSLEVNIKKENCRVDLPNDIYYDLYLVST